MKNLSDKIIGLYNVIPRQIFFDTYKNSSIRRDLYRSLNENIRDNISDKIKSLIKTKQINYYSWIV